MKLISVVLAAVTLVACDVCFENYGRAMTAEPDATDRAVATTIRFQLADVSLPAAPGPVSSSDPLEIWLVSPSSAAIVWSASDASREPRVSSVSIVDSTSLTASVLLPSTDPDGTWTVQVRPEGSRQCGAFARTQLTVR
jgi:hypothetical protein